MSRTRLNPLDAAWIVTESRATPNHVAAADLPPPEDAPRGLQRRLTNQVRSYRGFTAPWKRRPNTPSP